MNLQLFNSSHRASEYEKVRDKRAFVYTVYYLHIGAAPFTFSICFGRASDMAVWVINVGLLDFGGALTFLIRHQDVLSNMS